MKILDEYKKEKEKIENDFLEKLKSFQREFNCMVESVDLITICEATDINPKKIINVKLNVRI